MFAHRPVIRLLARTLLIATLLFIPRMALAAPLQAAPDLAIPWWVWLVVITVFLIVTFIIFIWLAWRDPSNSSPDENE